VINISSTFVKLISSLLIALLLSTLTAFQNDVIAQEVPQLPTLDDLLEDPEFVENVEGAWANSSPGQPGTTSERGFWIWSIENEDDTYSYRYEDWGPQEPCTSTGCRTTATDPNVNTSNVNRDNGDRLVGAFHTHPLNPTYGTTSYGPSAEDQLAQNLFKIPMYIRDENGLHQFGDHGCRVSLLDCPDPPENDEQWQNNDTDGDGVIDAEELGDDLLNPPDTDNDGIPDYLDPIDDGSGDNDNEGAWSQQFGDPHLSTPDLKEYSFQAAGDYLLTRSTDPDDTFEVQVRYIPFEDGDVQWSGEGALAMKVVDDTVELYVESGGNLGVYVNGERVSVDVGVPYALPSGGALFSGAFFTVSWPDGTILEASTGSPDPSRLVRGFSRIYFPGFRRDKVEGLLGNFDGRSFNDFRLRNGAVVDEDQLYSTYQNAWSIQQGASTRLFTQGTDPYDPAFPTGTVSLQDFPSEDVEAALQTCRDAGVVERFVLAACAFDILVTGNEAWAGVAADIDRIANELVPTISPGAVFLPPGTSQEFTAVFFGSGSDNITWSSSGGSINGTGRLATYTAPNEPGTYTVSARVADNGLIGEATVVVPSATETCEGNYRIDATDTEVDIAVVRGCEVISGYLSIVDTQLRELELENLRMIDGNLSITRNSELRNLRGLRNLTTVNGIYITDNDALGTLSGLENLTTVNLILSIDDNSALTSLAALDNITTLNFLKVEHSDRLTSLNGLDNITTLNSLDLSFNRSLTSLTALSNITTLDSLTIAGQRNLTNLDGLDNLTAIRGRLYISGNDALTSIIDLSSLTEVSTSIIEDNPQLDCSSPPQPPFLPATSSSDNLVDCPTQ